jgi:transcriptional regulator with XRE-family HTH domain
MTPAELKELRKRAGLSQYALALAMGLAPRSGPSIISAWENGHKAPKGPTLRALELALEKALNEKENKA